jgi:hypothetical protein
MEKQGVLYEISLWGTGFIDESQTHRALAFHHSMLGNFNKPPETEWPQLLEGREVSFVETAGKVSAVHLAKAVAAASFKTATA